MLNIFLLIFIPLYSCWLLVRILWQSTFLIGYNWSFFFYYFSVVKQLCREKELHNIHSADDFRLVNGQLLSISVLWDFLKELWIVCYLVDSHANHILLLLQLIVEGGTAIAIFIRCFTDKEGVEREMVSRLYFQFPREVLATISVILSYFINVSLQLFQMQIQFLIDLTFIEIWNVTGTPVSNDSLWFSSTRTTFLLSCSSH